MGNGHSTTRVKTALPRPGDEKYDARDAQSLTDAEIAGREQARAYLQAGHGLVWLRHSMRSRIREISSLSGKSFCVRMLMSSLTRQRDGHGALGGWNPGAH
jgi:hypothetical protein